MPSLTWRVVRHDLLPDGSIKPLHVQLAQNKAAKQEEWDAAHAFKNQIYTLAEEDVEFVEQVRDRQEKEEREKRDQLNAFRDMVKQRAVASAPVVPGIDEPSQTQTQQKKQVDVQKKLLGAVRVKRKEEAPKSEEEPPAKVPKAEEAPKSAETTKAVETKSAAKDAPPATNALGLAYGDSDDE